jgi:hypothetical protein
MKDMVHRVVTLDLTLQTKGSGPTRLAVRGAAGISLGSLKMLDAKTGVPPELVAVAFVAALGKLDSAMPLPAVVCGTRAD